MPLVKINGKYNKLINPFAALAEVNLDATKTPKHTNVAEPIEIININFRNCSIEKMIFSPK